MAQFVCEVLGLTTAATIDDGSPYADQLRRLRRPVPESATGDHGRGGNHRRRYRLLRVLGNIAADSPEFLYFPIFVAEGALITQQAQETRA